MNQNPSKSQKQILIGVGILGLFARLVLSYFSVGTNDAVTWHVVAQKLQSVGVYSLYALDDTHHQPPLISLISSYLIPASLKLGLSFEFCLRLLSILSDALCAVLIYKIWNKTTGSLAAALAFCVFCWNPLSILVSGYHGHTDPICAAFVLLSLYFLKEKKSAFLAGLSLGASINIKLIPLLLIPPLLTTLSSRKETRQFLVGLIPLTIPFLLGLTWVGEPFYRNIFQYNSVVDYWGFQTFLLLFYSNTKSDVFLSMSQFYHHNGRLLVLFFVLLLGWYNFKTRKLNAYEVAALSLTVFFIFSPGFGNSYLSILIPIVLCYSKNWGIKISVLGALCAVTSYLYFLVSWYPLQSNHNSTTPKIGVLLNFLLWFTLIVFLGSSFLHLHRKKS